MFALKSKAMRLENSKILRSEKGSAVLLASLAVGVSALFICQVIMSDAQNTLQRFKLARTAKIDFQNLATELVMTLSQPTVCALNLRNRVVSTTIPNITDIAIAYPTLSASVLGNVFVAPGLLYQRIQITNVDLSLPEAELTEPVEGPHQITLQITGRSAQGKIYKSIVPLYAVTDLMGKITSCRATSIDKTTTLEGSLCGTRTFDSVTFKCI